MRGVDRHGRGLASSASSQARSGVTSHGWARSRSGIVRRERVGIGEPGAGILRGEARDAAGLGDGLAQRAGAQVGGAGRALARAEVDGDAHAAVALVLDGLDLAEPHRDREAHVHADGGLGLGCAEHARLLERELDECEQVGAVGGDGGGAVFDGHGAAQRLRAGILAAAGPRVPRVLASAADGRPARISTDEPPSKSELKRQSRDLQDLGRGAGRAAGGGVRCAAGCRRTCATRSSPARRITSHGARVRQRLYIGKLLRNIDTGADPRGAWRTAPRWTGSASGASTRSRRGATGCSRTSLLHGPSSPHWSARTTCPSCRSLVRQARAERDAAARTVRGAAIVPPAAGVAGRSPRLRRDAAGATMPR